MEQARPTQWDRWPVALVLFPLCFSDSPCRLCKRPSNIQTFFSRSKTWLLYSARRRRGLSVCEEQTGYRKGKRRRWRRGAAVEAEQVFNRRLGWERKGEGMREQRGGSSALNAWRSGPDAAQTKGLLWGNGRGKRGTRHCVCRCIAGCCRGASC